MTARPVELAVIACLAFIGVASAILWLATVSASWPAVLLERAVAGQADFYAWPREPCVSGMAALSVFRTAT